MIDEIRYKCMHCKIVIPEGALVGGDCPQCNSTHNLVEMCPNDNITCDHGITEGIAYCELCGQEMCPVCKCHDVETVSRVTGYLSATSGWAAGKKQELKDRTRVKNAELEKYWR